MELFCVCMQKSSVYHKYITSQNFVNMNTWKQVDSSFSFEYLYKGLIILIITQISKLQSPQVEKEHHLIIL